MIESRKSIDWLYWLIALTPIVIFFGMVWKYALNIPFLDDYDAVLGFLVKYFDASTLAQKFHLIFAQHNEHRIVFNKLIELAQIYAHGVTDFRQLIFIGNIGLIGIFAVLYFSLGRIKNQILVFIPVSFLLFQPQYWENIHWAMASLQNFHVLFFAFISIFLVSKREKSFFSLGIIFAVLATFTQGNGMFVFPVGVAILLYQKRYNSLLIWIFTMIICVGFYFRNYIQPAQHPSIVTAFLNPFQTISYFFSFIGSSVGFGKFLSPYIGFATFIYFVIISLKKYFKQNIVIYGLFCFLFLSAAAAALTRSGLGLEQAFASRYSIISILFFVLIYLSLIDLYKNLARYIVAFIVAAILFNACAYYLYFHSVVEHHISLSESLEKWKVNGEGLLFPDQEGANKKLLMAIEKGIYK